MSNREILSANDRIHSWKLSSEKPPLFLSPRAGHFTGIDEFLSWVTENETRLGALLVGHGGIVFRGFPIASSDDFDRLVTLLGPFKDGYVGGAVPRAKIKGNVMETTQLAAELSIPLHQEMAYVQDYPGRIMFFCRKPAEQGGETMIGDMRKITADMPALVLAKLEKLGGCGIRNYGPPAKDGEKYELHPDQRPWTLAFETDNAEDVERICRSKGQETLWNEDRSLAIKTRTSAVVVHPVSKDKVYRSNIHLGDTYSNRPKMSDEIERKFKEIHERQKNRTGYFLGDMSALNAGETKALFDAFSRNEITWAWQPGDIMLLDNLLTAHGRTPFRGSRDVQVGLLA